MEVLLVREVVRRAPVGERGDGGLVEGLVVRRLAERFVVLKPALARRDESQIWSVASLLALAISERFSEYASAVMSLEWPPIIWRSRMPRSESLSSCTMIERSHEHEMTVLYLSQ